MANPRLRRFCLDIVILIGIFLLFAVGLVAVLRWHASIPSDASLEAKFIRHRETLALLADKISHEPPDIVGIAEGNRVMFKEPSHWVAPEQAGISPTAFAEYKSLLQKAEVASMARGDDATSFYVTGHGFAGYGWRLFFVKMKARPAFVVNSIDNRPMLPKGRAGDFYRPLGDDWYIRLHVCPY